MERSPPPLLGLSKAATNMSVKPKRVLATHPKTLAFNVLSSPSLYAVYAPEKPIRAEKIPPPTPLAVQGVLGAGQAGGWSHRNHLGGKHVLRLEGHGGERFGGTFLDDFCGFVATCLQQPKQPKKRTPTMLKIPPDQQRITSITDEVMWTSQGGARPQNGSNLELELALTWPPNERTCA